MRLFRFLLFTRQRKRIEIKMPGNHFGWSLSDAVENPRQTGLVNFRRYKLLQYQTNAGVLSGDDEDLASNTFQSGRLTSEETTTTQLGADFDSFVLPPFSRPVKPYYGRGNSVSQCSDSCFGSDYPSLTSTGIFLSFFFLSKLIELNQSSGAVLWYTQFVQHPHTWCLLIIYF